MGEEIVLALRRLEAKPIHHERAPFHPFDFLVLCGHGTCFRAPRPNARVGGTCSGARCCVSSADSPAAGGTADRQQPKKSSESSELFRARGWICGKSQTSFWSLHPRIQEACDLQWCWWRYMYVSRSKKYRLGFGSYRGPIVAQPTSCEPCEPCELRFLIKSFKNRANSEHTHITFRRQCYIHPASSQVSIRRC